MVEPATGEPSSNKRPLASIVIPTYNRGELLEKTLIALTRQTLPPDDFEVIVCSDGSTDDTAETVHRFARRLNIHFSEQDQAGPSVARNRGAEMAQADLLVFIDDDIETAPQFLEAHWRAHQQNPNLVLIGYLPPILYQQKGFFRTELLDWWEVMFQKMRRPGYRFGYTDLVSGNFSVPAALFKQVGMFDTNFRCHEDYELGIRLLKAGATFAFSIDAAGYHHEKTEVDRSFKRKYDEGPADVQIGRKYPELLPSLLFYRLDQYIVLPSKIMRYLAFTWPAMGDFLAALLREAMDVLGAMRFYYLWRRVLEGLLGYWYWRGVAGQLGSLRELRNFIAELARQEPQWRLIDLDLAQGLERSEQLLEAARPDGARLYFNEQFIGQIRPMPGGQKLRGEHLRPALANEFALQLVRALARQGALDYPQFAERVLARCEMALK